MEHSLDGTQPSANRKTPWIEHESSVAMRSCVERTGSSEAPRLALQVVRRGARLTNDLGKACIAICWARMMRNAG